ncbi:MAG: class I SAM-dependent methyltransferase [Candidatus Aenigmarchaeota archaeon]|nr:class I SAM-dependent methyltransferase [Candidatus Aenigmarchaeota archaeon]
MYKEKWLDVGCGGGEWVREMSIYNTNRLVIGIDKKRYTEWNEKPTNVEYLIADARNLPFKNKYFDHVHANILGPFDVKGICNTAKEMQRVLREGTVSFAFGAGVHHGKRK